MGHRDHGSKVDLLATCGSQLGSISPSESHQHPFKHRSHEASTFCSMLGPIFFDFGFVLEEEKPETVP